MAVNLELILVVLTIATGAVAVGYWARYRAVPAEERPPAAGLVEFCLSFFPVLALVLVLRSFVFEPFKIPSASMLPTLYEGDFIFVSKFSYGVRLPLIHTKLLPTGAPERGDVAVFRLPSNPSINYIKRVIGLPGDTIEYREGVLRINGERIRLEADSDFVVDGRKDGTIYTEYLGERSHAVLHRFPQSTRDTVRRIPAGCYFMMGDNRENSRDSRFREVGCVDEKHLVGRAWRIWFNFHWGDQGPQWPLWSRIGHKIE